MKLVIAPAMLEYLADLNRYAVGYHTDMDFIDLVKENDPDARDHKIVSMFSPCLSVELLRAFYSEEIVGVRIVQPMAMSKYYRLDPSSITTLTSLLHFTNRWLNEWAQFGDREGVIPEKERVKRARELHEKALQFDATYTPTIPAVIRAKMIARWKQVELIHPRSN